MPEKKGPDVSDEQSPDEDLLPGEIEEESGDDEELYLEESRPTPRRVSIFVPGIVIVAGVALALAGLLWMGRAEQQLTPILALGAGLLLAAGGVGAVIAQRQRRPTAPYEQEELNGAPDSIDTTTVEGHGDVKVGRTRVREPDGTRREYISIWIVPSADNECGRAGTYRWYQFVRINFFINNRKKRVRGKIKGATELYYPFDKWAPDYHKGDSGTVGPDFKPPGLTPAPADPGKPFKPHGIGGQLTAGGTSLRTGVVDAPNFCNRGRRKLSPIERLYRRFVRPREMQQRNPPAGWQRTVKVEVEARSYLVCIKDGQVQCIGCVGWTYTNEADLRMVWKRAGTPAGGIDPVWKVGSEIRACRHTVTVAGWTAGC